MISSDVGNTVFPAGVDAYDALQRLYMNGAMTNAKIVAFGWGLSGVYPDLNDLIDLGYYTRGFAFFSPAGSFSSSLGVVFPANKSEVFAATARTSLATPHPSAHTGPEVDGIAFAPIFVSGPNGTSSSLDVSSAATAQIAGIAAMVAQKYPTYTNAQIYNRLRTTTREYCGPDFNGVTKIINAEAAVGGLCVPPGQFVEVPYQFTPGGATSYTHNYCVSYSGGVWPVMTVQHVTPHPTLPGCGSVTFGPDPLNPSTTISIPVSIRDDFTPGNPPIVNFVRIRVLTWSCPPENPNCI